MKKIIVLVLFVFLLASCSSETEDNSSNTGNLVDIDIVGNTDNNNTDKTRLSSVDMVFNGDGQIGTNVFEPYITGENILMLSSGDADSGYNMILIAPELWSNYSTMDHDIGIANVKIHFIGEVGFIEEKDNISYYYVKSVEDLKLQEE